MHSPKDTIAALATASQSAAIGIIKLSGPSASCVLERVVPGSRASRRPRQVLFGRAIHPSTAEPIDDVLCFTCPGPRSSTGEDVAELQGHGSPAVMAALLDACLAAGCVLAHPGEFTYRAHCNGKVDLAQAESVAALIGARTQAAARVALGQLRGGLRTAMEPLSTELLQLCAALEASLDFPEDDIDQEAWAQLESRASHLAHELFLLARGYSLGKRLSHGARVALIGPVNAGKSSLLNALCGETRAIVDVEPGTTRDIVRATFDCGGIPVELLDTAGLRDEPGRIEQVGIERTKDAATTADLVVIVIDGSGETALDTAYFEHLQGATDAPIVLAVSKADLPGYDLARPLPSLEIPRLAVSARTAQGLDEMRQWLARLLCASEGSCEPPVVGTARQHEILCVAQGHVAAAAQLLTQGAEPELAGSELFRARKALTGLLGGDATEDLLEQIFSSYCIGK